MPPARKVEDEALLEGLSRTFKDVGYEGASLAVISEATGLKKSSLYHRFPSGKEQMAQEVLGHTARVLDAEIFPTLVGSATPAQKMTKLARALDGFYASGRESCLLNMLCPPRGEKTASGEAIAQTFERLLEAIGQVAAEAGATKSQARARAERVLVSIQGSLVVARGTGDAAVFTRAMARLPALIAGAE